MKTDWVRTLGLSLVLLFIVSSYGFSADPVQAITTQGCENVLWTPIVNVLLVSGLFGLTIWAIKGRFDDIKLFFSKQIKDLKDRDADVRKEIGDVLKETKSIDRRVARIEGHLGNLGPIMAGSPIKLTEAGEEILRDSGIREAADEHREALLAKIKEAKPETAFDVQEITRSLFQEYDFGPENVKKIKDYSFNSGKWGLYDIKDVGAVYFRDIALKELGHNIDDLDKNGQGKDGK